MYSFPDNYNDQIKFHQVPQNVTIAPLSKRLLAENYSGQVFKLR